MPHRDVAVGAIWTLVLLAGIAAVRAALMARRAQEAAQAVVIDVEAQEDGHDE